MENYCNEGENLEKQLECLRRKYASYTAQIDKERTFGVFSDEYCNVYDLLQKRVQLLKEMDIVRLKIKRKRDTVQKGVIDVGSRVIAGTKTVKLDFVLTQEDEADPDNELISITSPLGRAVFGKKVGDSVTVFVKKGKTRLKIKKVL